MGKKIILGLTSFLIAFFLSETLLMQRTYSVIDGAKSLRLINGCEMVFIDKLLQPVYTVVLDCPGKDSIRLWPLPVVNPWFEDWWEKDNDYEWEMMDIVNAFGPKPAFSYESLSSLYIILLYMDRLQVLTAPLPQNLSKISTLFLSHRP